jgi:hypothetical protein
MSNLNVINRYIQAYKNATNALEKHKIANSANRTLRHKYITYHVHKPTVVNRTTQAKLNLVKRNLNIAHQNVLNTQQKKRNLYNQLKEVIMIPKYHYKAGVYGDNYERAYYQAIDAKKFINRQKWKTRIIGMEWKRKAHVQATAKAAHIGLTRGFSQRQPQSVPRSNFELPPNVLRGILNQSGIKGNAGNSLTTRYSLLSPRRNGMNIN